MARKSRAGFNLIEVLITISVFTALGLLMSILTEQFVTTYMRSRELSDLQRMATSLFDEIQDGDQFEFDGLKNAVELIEARANSISFVPSYRDNSLPLEDYIGELMGSENISGPPSQDGRTSGGLRVQFNEASSRYELRWYLSRQPRAGSLEPQVYLHARLTEAERLLDPSSRVSSLPTRLVWRPPLNNGETPNSYLVFTGGSAPLFFPGDAQIPPSISQVQQIMATNPAQLFPNPFDRPDDRISVFYHPETETSIVDDQESLMAHIILKDASFDPLRPLWNLASNAELLSEVERLPQDSFILLYNNALKSLPSRTALMNSNLSRFRIQFPTALNSRPASRMSYISSRSTSGALDMVLNDGVETVPYDQIASVASVRMDLQAIMGGLLSEHDSQSLMSQKFSGLIPLETRAYSQAIHTRASTLSPQQGFSRENCLPGAPPTLRCRHITSNLPSGAQIRVSETFFFSGLVWDVDLDQGLEGVLSIVIRSPENLRIYKVSIDFDTATINIQKKNTYTQEDLDFNPDVPDDNVVSFPLDNSQFINMANLQASGFLDEDFNYISPNIHQSHLGNAENLELYLELSSDCNLEGMNMVWTPR